MILSTRYSNILLNFLDRERLVMVLPIFKKILVKEEYDPICYLRVRLKDMGIDPDIFIDTLRKTNSIIAGLKN